MVQARSMTAPVSLIPGKARGHRPRLQLYCRFDEFIYVAQLVQASAQIDQFVHACGRQRRYHLISKLLFKLLVAQRPPYVPERFFNKMAEYAAVFEFDVNMRLIFSYGWIPDGCNQFADFANGR